MPDIHLNHPDPNPARLDADLRAALGAVCHGLSVSGERVTVHLADDAALDHIDTAQAIVRTHDGSALTPAQAREAARKDMPFFKLADDDLLALVEGMDAAEFRHELARAFAHLRDLMQDR